MAAKRVKFTGETMTIEDEPDAAASEAPAPEAAAHGSTDPAGAPTPPSDVMADPAPPVVADAGHEGGDEPPVPHPASLDGLATLLGAGTRVSRAVWRLPADALPEQHRRWLTISRIGGDLVWAMPLHGPLLITRDDVVATDWEVIA